MGQKSMTSVHFSRSQLLLCKKIQKLNCLYLQNLSCYCFLIYGMFSICKDLLEYVKILNVGQPEHGVMTTWHSWSFFLLRTRLKKQYKCWSEMLWQVMPYGWGVCIIVFTCKFFNYLMNLLRKVTGNTFFFHFFLRIWVNFGQQVASEDLATWAKNQWPRFISQGHSCFFVNKIEKSQKCIFSANFC